MLARGRGSCMVRVSRVIRDFTHRVGEQWDISVAVGLC